jgi:hypothetical protein
MSEEHCMIAKAALSCCRRTDFDAVQEMGILNRSVVFLILLMLSMDRSEEVITIALDPTQALSAVFKIVRHYLTR